MECSCFQNPNEDRNLDLRFRRWVQELVPVTIVHQESAGLLGSRVVGSNRPLDGPIKNDLRGGIDKTFVPGNRVLAEKEI
jgi:hypothetical protein